MNYVIYFIKMKVIPDYNYNLLTPIFVAQLNKGRIRLKVIKVWNYVKIVFYSSNSHINEFLKFKYNYNIESTIQRIKTNRPII